jgi:homoserine dehydrogenase
VREIPFVLIGVGNLGRRFCEIARDKAPLLRDEFELALRLVAVGDSQGGACDAETGIDLDSVVAIKRGGGTVGDLPVIGRKPWPALDLVARADAEILLEASPVNLALGAQPGLACIRTALERGMHVVTPNKGPLVLAYDELIQLAARRGVELRYDGTVAGGLPAVNLGQRDLRGGVISRLEAVPNLSTGFVMDLVGRGASWNEAIALAARDGTLEGDGTWDLDGWDAAAKLVILSNAVLGIRTHMSDVRFEGIRSLDAATLREAHQAGKRYRLLARAIRTSSGCYDLSVSPVCLTVEHPLGRLSSKQMGVVYYTDIYGTIVALVEEQTPIPSAATMLRDLLDIYLGRQFGGDKKSRPYTTGSRVRWSQSPL